MDFRPQHLVGKTIYRGSSYAPTRGQNNPQGYINRELNNKKQGPFGGVSQFGATGRSETRSGLAKDALQRMLQAKPGMDNVNGNSASGKGVAPPGQGQGQGLAIRPWLRVDNVGRITLPLKSRRLFKAKQQATENMIAQILDKGM